MTAIYETGDYTPTLQTVFKAYDRERVYEIFYSYRYNENPEGDKLKMRQETERMIDDIIEGRSKYAQWRIADVYDFNYVNGLYAVTILTEEHEAIVAFRGSESFTNTFYGAQVMDPYQMLFDWFAADGGIALCNLTEQEKCATAYLTHILLNPEYEGIAVTGHSLGGDLAHVSTMLNCDNPYIYKISQSVSFDGPGHPQLFHMLYQREKNAVKDILVHYRWSFVGNIYNTLAESSIDVKAELFESSLFKHSPASLEYKDDMLIRISVSDRDELSKKIYEITSDCAVPLAKRIREIYGDNNGVFSGTINSETIYGSEGMDFIYGNEGDDTIYGKMGNDYVSGGAGNDNLYGNEGNDDIYGDDGQDTIYGGSGDDYVEGGNGNDIIRGESGNDTLYGNEGYDYIYGESGNDYIEGGSGSDYLYGGDGNDRIYGITGYNYIDGGAGDDLIFGGDGNDKIYGGSGSDYLVGQSGNDRLEGEEGMDLLHGGSGADTLLGGFGNDSYFFNKGDGQDIIIDFENSETEGRNDSIVFGEGIRRADLKIRRDYDDLIIEYGDGDIITVQRAYIPGWKEIEGSRFIENIILSDGTVIDKEWINEIVSNRYGTEEDDCIAGYMETCGYTGDEIFYGYGGNDTIYGQGGDDIIFGHLGNDELYGGEGNDSIYGGNGNDTLYGGDGDDTLLGGDGNDIIDGSDGDNTLLGGDGNDTIYGGSGHDILVGGKHNDRLEGGYGPDTYLFELGDGNDIIFDMDCSIAFGEGIRLDAMSIRKDSNDIYIEVSDSDSIRIAGAYSRYNVPLLIDFVELQGGTTWTFEDISKVISCIKGTEADDTIEGDFAGGWVTIDGTTVYKKGPYDRNETFYGYGGNDSIRGRDGNDTIYGGDGSDYLDGGEDDDILIGGKDNDSLYGGIGNDTYIFDLGDGNDVIYDYQVENADKIVFGEGIDRSKVKYKRNGGDVIIEYSENDNVTISSAYVRYSGLQEGTDGSRLIEFIEFADGTVLRSEEIQWIATSGLIEGSENADVLNGYNGNINYGDNKETIYGYGGNDRIFGNGGDDTLYGGDGDDTLYGDSGNDSLYGDEGDDVIYGNEGDDTIHGGNGYDTIHGGNGNDLIYGGDQSDYIYGEEGNNTIYGGSGTDYIFGGEGSDTIYGEEDHDYIEGYGGDDIIYGGDGGDEIYGWAGNDFISGDSGNDYINGGDGNDKLFGGIGDDSISGSDGDDFIDGGEGNDSIYGDSGNNVLYGRGGNDNLISSGDGITYAYGGDGSDSIYLGQGDDHLIGGEGNDILCGSGGDDVYLFNIGDGEDTILEWEDYENTIVFGGGINFNDVKVKRENADLMLGYGNGDSICIANVYYEDEITKRVKKVVFSDRTCGLINYEAERMDLSQKVTTEEYLSYIPSSANTDLSINGLDCKSIKTSISNETQMDSLYAALKEGEGDDSCEINNLSNEESIMCETYDTGLINELDNYANLIVQEMSESTNGNVSDLIQNADVTNPEEAALLWVND